MALTWTLDGADPDEVEVGTGYFKPSHKVLKLCPWSLYPPTSYNGRRYCLMSTLCDTVGSAPSLKTATMPSKWLKSHRTAL
jgi:hypothetical protein